MNDGDNWDAPVNLNGVTIDFDGTGVGSSLIVNAPFQGAGGGVTGGIGNMTVQSGQTAGLTINSTAGAGAVGLRFGGNAGLTIDAGAGAVTFGGSNNAYLINLGTGTSNFVNNSVSTATVNSNVTFNATGGTVPILAFGGTGNWVVIGTTASPATTSTVTGLVKNGAGELQLRGPHNYTGETIINEGLLFLGGSTAPSAPRQLPIGTVVTVGAAGTLRINGLGGSATNNEIIGGLQGSGLITTTNSGSISRLTIDNAADFTFGGQINANDRLLIIKEGVGTQTFTGNSNYAGSTTINGGTLLVNGANAGTGGYVVNAGGTLGGTGVFAGAASVAADATLAPGGVGVLESLGAGNLTFADNAVYHWDFLGAAADVTNVQGTLAFGSDLTLIVNSLDAAELVRDIDYVLFTFTGVDPVLPNINVQGIDQTGLNFRVENNQVLVAYVIPEPATLSLLALGGLGLLRRRRAVR